MNGPWQFLFKGVLVSFIPTLMVLGSAQAWYWSKMNRIESNQDLMKQTLHFIQVDVGDIEDDLEGLDGEAESNREHIMLLRPQVESATASTALNRAKINAIRDEYTRLIEQVEDLEEELE